MDTSFSLAAPYEKPLLMAEQNRRLTETVARESGRLGSFIRQRVPDPGEAEDILQEVFFELFEAWRLPDPIEQVGAWLFRVARNRTVDRFRKRREEPLPSTGLEESDEATHWLENAMPASDGGPEATHLRRLWLAAPPPTLPPGTEAGIIASTRSLGLGGLLGGLPRPNDGTVAVAETRLPGASDFITLPVTHSGMLLSAACAAQVAHFLAQGRFRYD